MFKRKLLSPREKQIVGLKAKGFYDKEIAKELEISYGSVRNYIDRAKLKINASTTFELISIVKDLGLLKTL